MKKSRYIKGFSLKMCRPNSENWDDLRKSEKGYSPRTACGELFRDNPRAEKRDRSCQLVLITSMIKEIKP